MAETSYQDASGRPDHGLGPIGQVAHAFLSAERASTDLPKIAMAFNTLPDAPGPPGYRVFDMLPELWQAAGEDLHRYVAMLAHGLRSVSTMMLTDDDRDRLEESHPTRMDGIVVVFGAAAMRIDQSPAASALAANITEGYYRRGDVTASPTAQHGLMAMATSRADDSVLLSLPPGAISPISEMPANAVVRGPLIEGLAALLSAFWDQIQAIEKANQLDT